MGNNTIKMPSVKHNKRNKHRKLLLKNKFMNIKGLENYIEKKASKICLGTFDGLHNGHKKLTETAEFMVTFDPHPKEVLTGVQIPRLTTTEEQAYFFPNQIIINFTKKISQMTAIDFLNQIIKKYLNPSSITIGYDFKFGVNGQGNINSLKEWGKKTNCKIITIDKQTHLKKTPYKSSIIRDKLKTDPAHGLELLGHPYLIIGTVTHGEKRGRLLGFPTANLKVSKTKCIPKFGVYKSHVIVDEVTHESITYIGRKPSFENQQPSIETHILNNFDQTIYEKKIHLFLDAFIRPEIKFNSKEELINQIKNDINISYS